MNRVYNKDNFYFWENLVRNTDNILFGGNDKRIITSESVIIYIGILDIEKDILRSGWSCHDDVDTALGFLQHVFIPTSFYTWIDRKSEGLFIPLSPFDVLKHEVFNDINELDDRAYIDATRMERSYYFLNSIWENQREVKNEKIKNFCQYFNSEWNKEPERKLFIRMFREPLEIYNYIFEGGFGEVIEEEIRMSMEDFKFICEHACDEPLINKNLIKILNRNIPVWF
ncbi:hypothetical protein Amet_3012 [Alkaliphilus metalliredigens QYMF]|uniref:Uncharacterized protein n=1 Tax=Alkaliphilus metalliredigens (strain QYMF) TaxID=293826 RepID=A6TSI4_ALKMQ|nr:hypothetical protein [Alkaliphilus metalliredigens]ABR49152.1 hypothetical protein Amet_3012 [Alkaliphilus metalliredigens QYMF]